MFGREVLEDGRSLRHYCIGEQSTVHLVLILRCGGEFVLTLDRDLLDPKYDCDFTGRMDSGKIFTRGGLTYKRPCGWKRYGLNVIDKYDNNKWLGCGHRIHRIYSVDNEWPVSYHGTAKSNCQSIAEEGYKLCKGKRFTFGIGIYSTPDIEVAARYATKFTHEGKSYQLVFQNRINPDNFVPNSNARGEFWISPKGSDLRPYAICIKECPTQQEIPYQPSAPPYFPRPQDPYFQPDTQLLLNKTPKRIAPLGQRQSGKNSRDQHLRRQLFRLKNACGCTLL